MPATPSMPRPPRQEPPEFTLWVRVKRSLQRRFPRLHIAYNWTRARIEHYRMLYLGRLRPARLLATIRWGASLARAIAARRREPRLTVAVDVGSLWEELTGIGWYLYRILDALAGRDDVAIRLYGPTVVASPDMAQPVVELPRGPALERVLHPIPDDLLIPKDILIRRLRDLEPLLIALDGNRVIFAPNFFLPRRFRLCRASRVATIHDLGLRRVPETLRPSTLQDLTDRLEHAVLEADRLITVSATVRDELAAYGYASFGRVRVVHHGPGHLSEVTPGDLPAGIPDRFALHVGTLEPRKNVLGLLAAWRLLLRERPDAPALVLCGRFGWKTGEIRAAVAAAADEGWLFHPGYVDDRELAALYRRAAVVVFPSLYEGFGLPAVEAQWAGTPLVCSDLPVLREVAGDGALFVPPQRPEALAAAVARVLDDPALADDLVSRGRERVRQLDWSLAGRKTLAAWREAAGQPPGPITGRPRRREPETAVFGEPG